MNLIQRSERGAALAIVLGLLVITFCLTVMFLSQVNVERGASSGFAASTSTKALSDTAVNLVQGQIYDATDLGMDAAWASQPGMIRVYGSSSGPAQKAYKLYSSAEMILENPTAAELAADLPPATWQSEPGVWSDLNEPVTAGGRAVYPILSGDAIGNVEGFSYTPGVVASTRNPVPMPVRWLYVLQDGQIVAPTANGSLAGVAGSSESNLVVGRIAFWTDDETSKLNINTSSDGTFWDTPRINSAEERTYARYQPAQKEFQRYLGHPAMTSLAPVLFAANGVAPSILSQAERDALYALTPRVVGGGSDGGSVIYTSNSPLALDNDRLYADVDELIFNPTRNDQAPALALDREKLEQGRFFMTAVSRAPELTLFNTPRVAIWPIDLNDTTGSRSAFDRLIAFCATIDDEPYYFTRSDPQSATNDFALSSRNQALYAYLQRMTEMPIPGFGGHFLNKYPATSGSPSDRDQILTQIYDYIRTTNLSDPTVSTNFNDRGAYGTLKGLGQVTPIRIGNTRGFGRFPLISELGIHFICTADGGTGATGGVAGSNVSGNITLPRDSGGSTQLLAAGERRIEAMIVMELFVPSMGWPAVDPSMTFRIRGLDSITVGSGASGPLFPASRFPAAGVVGSSRNNSVGSISGGRSYGGSISHRWLYANGRSPARLNGQIPADTNPNPHNDPFPIYPFISDPITIPSAGTMALSSGTITIEVYAGQHDDVTGMTPVYTVETSFPTANIPVPNLVQTPTAGVTPEGWWTFSATGAMPGVNGRLHRAAGEAGRADIANSLLGAAPFVVGDVVRTLIPDSSDYRLLVGSSPGYRLIPHVPATALSHNLTEGGRSAHFLGYRSSGLNRGLASGATYNLWSQPNVPVYSAASERGDWDNGVALIVDGTYINKADEGNTSSPSGGVPYFDAENTYAATGVGRFSPNRQMPSAGMFGSLPTGVHAGREFETLLFRPQPNHPQSRQSRADQPEDHLIADLFWMPVVEPYAISEPFSTAGKINLNYAIMPFSYIHRATALHGLMRSERLLAVAQTNAINYKVGWETPAATTRTPIDIPQTLLQLDARFRAGDLFRSATEICDIYLIPSGQTWIANAAFSAATLATNASNFWANHTLTGDNVREQPYTNLLGRLTTRSNTYTVHYRVQALKQSQTSAVDGVWDESRDAILGEYRGSTAIERYISPNTEVPDYASATDLSSLDSLNRFYRWRVLNTRRFAP